MTKAIATTGTKKSVQAALEPILDGKPVVDSITSLVDGSLGIFRINGELESLCSKWDKASIVTEKQYKLAGAAVIEIDDLVKEIEGVHIAHGKSLNYYKKQLHVMHKAASALSKEIVEKYVKVKKDLKEKAGAWFAADVIKKNELQQKIIDAENMRVADAKQKILNRAIAWEAKGSPHKAEQLREEAGRVYAAPVVIRENKKTIEGSGLTASLKPKVTYTNRLAVLELITAGTLGPECVDVNIAEIENAIDKKELTAAQLPGIIFKMAAGMSIRRK